MHDSNDRNIDQKRERRQRWLWFVALYAGSLLAFTVIVYFLRWLIVK